MGKFFLQRLIRFVVVVAWLTAVVFVIVRASGDPVNMFVSPQASREEADAMRVALGLDRPLYEQFFSFARRWVVGDFGNSLQFGRPAMPLVLERLPATVELASTALVLSLLIGIPLGVMSAIREGSFLDFLGQTLGVLGRTVPGFWLSLVLILIFSVTLRWLPTSGRGTPAQLILPAVSLAVGFVAQIALLVRAGMLDVLREDYIRTARAKGLSPRTVNYRHAFRNALIPVVTVIGLRFGTLLGGAVITETVFAWPGVGRLAATGVYARDFPLVVAAVMVMAIGILLVNLLVDVLYTFLDPRISYES